jgi:hypothetical protein
MSGPGNFARAVGRRIAATPARLRKMMEAITIGRVMVFAYLLVAVAVAVLVIPGRNGGKHYQARRYMGVNTRLSAELLQEPNGISLEDRLWLRRERARLLGKYLTSNVEKDGEVKDDMVKALPDVKAGDAVAVELTAQPDWVYFNQGSVVQVWAGKNETPERLHVLAVVPSGDNKWLALLSRGEVRQQNFFNPKEATTIRLDAPPEKPPEKPQEASGQQPPPPAQTATPAGEATPAKGSAAKPKAGSRTKRRLSRAARQGV